MVEVAGHAVGTEGQHRVGRHGDHDLRQATDGVGLGDVRARAIGVVEPVVLAYTEEVERRRHLDRTDVSERRERPPFDVSGPELASCRGDADDA